MQSQRSKISTCAILAAMVLAIVTVELRASDDDSPTTQPTSQPTQSVSRSSKAIWSATVTAFATALVDPSDTATLNHVLAEDVVIRQFNRAGRQELSQLRDQAGDMRVIMSRGYSQTPTGLAGDIAAAIRDVSLPDDLKRRLTPADDAALKRANLIANKWIAASLFTSGSEPVAVVVLWKDVRPEPRRDETEPSDDEAKPVEPRVPIFVLLKGDVVGERMQISQICFGDPLPFSVPDTTDGAASSGD